MFDRVFGKVEYDYGWCTTETINLFDTMYNISCVASAYKGENISREQRTRYSAFKDNKEMILKDVEGIIKGYVEHNHSDFFDKLETSITPKELIFHQNGDAGIFFDCDWDIESGIVITIYPKLGICHPDLFL